MNRDMHKIFETYKSTAATKEIVQEGILDQLKARGAGAVGAVKGLGNRVAGATKGAIAGVKGDTAGVQAAAQQTAQGKIQGDIAKIESYRQTALGKFNKVKEDVMNDINALGLSVGKVSSKSLNTYTTNLDRAFQSLIDDMKKSAGLAPQSQTPPPVPQQPPNQAQQQQTQGQGQNTPPAPGTP